ncbi:hypothetical protein BT69DRAFT_145159 [Atractiella rhizophila]|nr:hypothetical protein BT69DRAFT_145159 [Atractiella rhizophila]
MKKLLRDPTYDLSVSEKLRFKRKVERYLQSTNQSHIACFRSVWLIFDRQLDQLFQVLYALLPFECFLPLWEQRTRQTLSGLQKAVGLLDYSVSDLVNRDHAGLPNTFEGWLALCWQGSRSRRAQTADLDTVKGPEKSHLDDLPYRSTRCKKGMEQDSNLLIRCATLCLNIDAPSHTISYDTLLSTPILNHERSIPQQAAEERMERVSSLFKDVEAMGEWKDQITSLKDQLILICAKKTLQSHAPERLQRSLSAGKGGDEDVKRILDLVKLVPDPQECEAAVKVMAQWILTTTKRSRAEIIQGKVAEAYNVEAEEAPTPSTFVERTVAALNAIDVKVTTLGEGPFFAQVTDKASTELVNMTDGAANLLSSYIDAALRKRGNTLQTPSLDVNDVWRVFSFLDAKDIFLELHARLLARRIMRFEFKDEGKEREIARLVSGEVSEYQGRKILRILADVDSSNALIGRFNHEKKSRIAFNAIVLSASVSTFTLSETDGIKLPKELEPLHDEFNEFFAKDQRGRKLTHVLHLSTVELQTRFTNEKYTIHASLPQAAILLLFTLARTTATLAIIAEEVGLTEEAAKPLLKGLVKQKLLLFDDEEFHLNLQYCSTRVRIPLHRLHVGKNEEEISTAMRQVDKSRQLIIEAAVVRVMKCSKQLPRQDLLKDTISAVHGHFRPTDEDIKHAIRELVEKEVLREIDGEPAKYAYVA